MKFKNSRKISKNCSADAEGKLASSHYHIKKYHADVEIKDNDRLTPINNALVVFKKSIILPLKLTKCAPLCHKLLKTTKSIFIFLYFVLEQL